MELLGHSTETKIVAVIVARVLCVGPHAPAANGCSRNAYTDRSRSEALAQMRPMRSVKEGAGTGSLASDTASRHSSAQSGRSDTPRPRSTMIAIVATPSISKRSPHSDSRLGQLQTGQGSPTPRPAILYNRCKFPAGVDEQYPVLPEERTSLVNHASAEPLINEARMSAGDSTKPIPASTPIGSARSDPPFDVLRPATRSLWCQRRLGHRGR